MVAPALNLSFVCIISLINCKICPSLPLLIKLDRCVSIRYSKSAITSFMSFTEPYGHSSYSSLNLVTKTVTTSGVVLLSWASFVFRRSSFNCLFLIIKSESQDSFLTNLPIRLHSAATVACLPQLLAALKSFFADNAMRMALRERNNCAVSNQRTASRQG